MMKKVQDLLKEIGEEGWEGSQLYTGDSTKGWDGGSILLFMCGLVAMGIHLEATRPGPLQWRVNAEAKPRGCNWGSGT